MHFGTFAAAVVMTLVVCNGCRAADAPSEPPGAATPSLSRVEESQTVVGEPNGVVTLRDAMAIALARNPELGVFPYELRAADARVLQAGLRPNPQLDIEVEEFGGRRERDGFDAAETTVQIGQPIELGGKRVKRTHVASLDKELVQWDYKAARLDVMREVTRAFAAVLAAQERLALAERLLELSRQAQSAVAQRVKAGKDSPVEELRADIVLSESRIERRKAQNALTTARHSLAAAWGGRTPVFEKVEGDFYKTPEPRPLAEMSNAISDNPDLARWQTEEDKRRAALRLEPSCRVSIQKRIVVSESATAGMCGLTKPMRGGLRSGCASMAPIRAKPWHSTTCTGARSPGPPSGRNASLCSTCRRRPPQTGLAASCAP